MINVIQPDWAAPPHIKAYTTTRHSWGKRDASWNTNQGFHTANSDEYNHLKRLIALPSEPVWLTQIHSAVALAATPDNREKPADASFTTESNRVCAVLTADCLPVLLCNTAGTQVAAIHAGWRGLASGIIEATIKAMNMPAGDLLAWLGPAIGPNRFEVGRDVYTAFTNNDPASINAFTTQPGDKWLADLYKLATIRLNRLGVTEISGGNFCTYTQDDLFYSYRRDQGKTGRMVSLIWITQA